MNVCVNITSGPLSGTLEDDDLRGEGRWERQVARGLLRAGHRVSTPTPKWGGDSGTPDWVGHVEDLSDFTYLTVYGGLASVPRGARAYVLQFFSAPDLAIEAEVRALMAREGHERVCLTHSYPSDGCFDRTAADLRGRTALLPTPAADAVARDATDGTALFHPSRNSLRSLTDDGGATLRLVRHALADARLTFELVSGTYLSEAADAIWALPLFRQLFGDVHDRVVVHPPLTYPEVQAVYARTRLVVAASGYGGPPIESARHGVPVVARPRDCSHHSAPHTPGFPELPRVGVNGALAEILGRLLRDPAYARRVGDAGRRYVERHFSVAAFDAALRSLPGVS